jgi:hypothetical protein
MKEKWTPHIIAATALVVFIVLGLASATLPGSASGTGSNLGNYDSNIPEEQLCTLEIAGGLKVIGFNGTVVSWAENGTGPNEGSLSSNAWRAMMKGSKYKTTIKIPAGDHTLHANLYLWDYNSYPGLVPGSGYVRASGLEISHNFQPGQTYFLRPVIYFTKGFSKKEYELLEYSNSGPGSSFRGAKLRIDENGTPVAEGNKISR